MAAPESTDPRNHPFVRSPHFTLFSMSLPLLLSLVAEPLTGLCDTSFISRLGSVSLAAVGVGATSLSSILWVFNFLTVGTQTEVANALGQKDMARIRQINSLALLMAAAIGLALIVLLYPFSDGIVRFMGADQKMHAMASAYFTIRLFGGPAVLVSIAAFGIMRGMQDMKTPFKIAVAVNILNVFLDVVLIFGLGPVPAFGAAGAAVASSVSQWIGAAWAVWAIVTGVGVSKNIRLQDAVKLLQIGGDIFIRTGMLTVFILLTTRQATLVGADSGAAHQAIRQFWVFTALFLDAHALTGQSLVGYFLGAHWPEQVRRVAGIVCFWAGMIGGMIGVAMILGRPLIEAMLVPDTAVAVFRPAWLVTCLFQPVNGVAFGTDGIHWGTGDFKFLRNVMLLGTLFCIGLLFLVDMTSAHALTWIWAVTILWIGIRALFGVLRIWPGIGASPFKAR